MDMKELFLFTRDQLSILTKNIFYYISKESAIVCGTCRYGHQRVISFYQRSIVYINQGIGSPKFLLQSLICRPKYSISDSKRHGANKGLALKTDSSLRPAQGIVSLF
jgi:hypothetical protein